MIAPITAVKASLGELVELVAVAFAAEKVVEFIKSQGEAAEANERIQKTLGLTAVQVQQLAFAAKMSGLSIEDVTQSMLRFELALAKAATGTGPAAAGLRSIGISAKELIGIPAPEQLAKMADAVHRLTDGPQKIAALEAINREFPKMITLLDEGSGRFAELNGILAKTNSVVEETANEHLVKMNNSLKVLGESASGLAKSVFAPFVDVVTGFVTVLADAAQALGRLFAESTPLRAALDLIAIGMKGVETVLATGLELLKDIATVGQAAFLSLAQYTEAFGGTIKETFDAVGAGFSKFWAAVLETGSAAFRALGQEAMDFADLMGKALTFDAAGAKAAFGQMGTDLKTAGADIKGAFAGVFDMSGVGVAAKAAAGNVVGIWKAAGAQIIENERQYGQEYDAIWGNLKKPEEGPPKQQPGPLDLTNGTKAAEELLKIAEAEASAEVDAFKKAATAREKQLDEQLKMHQLTMSQWADQTQDALQDEEQGIKAAYDRELQAAKGNSAQIIEIKKKEAAAIADIEQKIRDANAKAAEAEVAAWKSVADGIAGLLNSQVNGLLRGTETIGTAFKNMAASAIEALIQLGIKLAAEAALAEALSIATGGAVGGGAGGVLSGFIGSLGHFATGTPYVQNTGLALIHQGEMVTPAHLNPNNPANTLGSSGSSSSAFGSSSSAFHMGGMTVHNHGQAPDGAKLGRDFIREIQRKGVFAGNSARRYVGV